MLPAPRVIAIDDEPEHLRGLSDGLNGCGVACLPIRFTGETEGIPTCPNVRVIFADLNLTGGAWSRDTAHFSVIGGLIEDTIRPSGPYVIVLWTGYPEEADELDGFLKERLRDVTKPFAVRAIDKKDHLGEEGRVRDAETLVGAVREIVAGQRRIEALLNWEERVLDAAGGTVSSILELTGAIADPSSAVSDAVGSAPAASPDDKVGRLLASLAVAAVGREHVEKDRFRAVNEALLPVLADRIASMPSREEDGELWNIALGDISRAEQSLTAGNKSKLNCRLHMERPKELSIGTERGMVIELPENSRDRFESLFELDPETAARKQFWCTNLGEDEDHCCWVLVQTQAACDYAQKQPGPLPFHLGLYLPASEVPKNRKPPTALWTSPPFAFDDDIPRRLHVNARFQVSLTRAKAAEARPLFRLREQLVNDLTYHLHSYGARPGIISFRQ